MKSHVIVPLLFVTSAFATAAFAGDRATSSARELAKQGLAAYDAGRYEEAAEKLGKAYAVVHVPTLAVNEARALAKLGKLVAASELYLEASRIPGDKSWQSAQIEAQKDAERERAELLTRIPRLKVELKGAKSSEVRLTLDGAEVPSALLDEEQVVDPGERRIEGTRGSEVVKQSVSVKEGDHAVITLQFTQKLTGAAAAKTAGDASPKNQNESQAIGAISPLAAPPMGDSKPHGSAQKTVGWVTFGAGAAGIVVGGVTGILAASKRSSLIDSGTCSDNRCSPSQQSDVNGYNSLRTISTVGFIAGGVLAATGIVLVVTAPKQETQPHVGLWLGPSSAGVYGGF